MGNVEGGGQGQEALGGQGIVRVGVGVAVPGQTAVGAAQVGRVGVLGQTEDGMAVGLFHAPPLGPDFSKTRFEPPGQDGPKRGNVGLAAIWRCPRPAARE